MQDFTSDSHIGEKKNVATCVLFVIPSSAASHLRIFKIEASRLVRWALLANEHAHKAGTKEFFAYLHVLERHKLDHPLHDFFLELSCKYHAWTVAYTTFFFSPM